MRKYLYLSLFIIVILIGFRADVPKRVYAQVTIPSISPYWIRRQTYDNAGALLLSKLKSAQAAQDTKSLFTIVPSALGATGILLGSVLAWLNSRRRQKVFKKYMEDIELAQKEYSSSVLENSKNRPKLLAKLKENFSTIREKADLSAGNKKIDEEQRTTISNTIQRKLEEIGKTS